MYLRFNKLEQFFRCLIRSIIKHNTISLAAVIAFFGLSAMIPLALLLIYGASVFVPNTSVQKFLYDLLQSYVPTLPDAKSVLVGNLSRLAVLGSKQVGIAGVIGLLWTAIGGFVSFQQILDIIWEIRERRSFIKQYLVGFGMLVILLSLTIITSIQTSISQAVIRKIFAEGNNLTFWLTLFHEISRLSFPLLLYLTCYFCFRFLPSQPIKNSYLLVGALFSTIGIYLSQIVFIWYSQHLKRFEMIYGSLTFIMLFTFWAYIVCVIVLFGAEVAVTLKNLKRKNSLD